VHVPWESQERLYSEVAADYGGALERLARAYERNADKRRDLLQEIHVGLWRSLAHFDGRCSLRTWVYRVAHNIATSYVIRPQRHAPVLVGSEQLESIPSADDGEKLIDRRLTLDKLYELIQRLPPVDRQVMILYLEEIDAAAIAEITGLTAGSVATRIHRLKHALTRRFHQRGTDDE
jgi:RNA polymerase sigma-70 factor, ECF subfamily